MSLGSLSCKRGPEIFEYKNLKGYVIGKENCNTDESKDYWLIDFTYGSRNPSVGDTIVLNGITFTDVLKTTKLDTGLKIIGLRVSIDYIDISANKINTSSCSITTPLTYLLKELTFNRQGEIR